MKIGDKTTMKVQVPIIHLVLIFMISRSSTYHNTDYVEFGIRDFLECLGDFLCFGALDYLFNL